MHELKEEVVKQRRRQAVRQAVSQVANQAIRLFVT